LLLFARDAGGCSTPTAKKKKKGNYHAFGQAAVSFSRSVQSTLAFGYTHLLPDLLLMLINVST